jgi:hypothetical protein
MTTGPQLKRGLARQAAWTSWSDSGGMYVSPKASVAVCEMPPQQLEK